jgi:hypothetical protein
MSSSIIYASTPLFQLHSARWLRGTLNDVPNGVTVTRDPEGDVLSVQPDGRYDGRPPGTAGAYEVAQLVHDKLVFQSNGTLYVVPIVRLDVSMPW